MVKLELQQYKAILTYNDIEVSVGRHPNVEDWIHHLKIITDDLKQGKYEKGKHIFSFKHVKRSEDGKKLVGFTWLPESPEDDEIYE